MDETLKRWVKFLARRKLFDKPENTGDISLIKLYKVWRKIVSSKVKYASTSR